MKGLELEMTEAARDELRGFFRRWTHEEAIPGAQRPAKVRQAGCVAQALPERSRLDGKKQEVTGRTAEANARDRAKPRLSLRFARCLQSVRFPCTSANPVFRSGSARTPDPRGRAPRL
jgi:hypothetical protein